MSTEGYILTIEGCPYAFPTSGCESVVPTHADWSSDWTLVSDVLQNPSDYVSWNERSLPIEGDLEVGSIGFNLYDKHVENFFLYDTTTFNGNLMTELFTHAARRNHKYQIIQSFVSSDDADVKLREVVLFGNDQDLLTDPTAANYSATRITCSMDMRSAYPDVGLQTIWIEDEAISIAGITGTSHNILKVGSTFGVESDTGRGLYGSEKKYHRIKETYKPEVFFKHPPIIKRSVILWRVSDTSDNSSTSIFPIWRGFARNNPELSDDGSKFVLQADHKWTFYKNEQMDYPGFSLQFSIPERTYSSTACYMTYIDNFTGVRTVFRSDAGHTRIIYDNAPSAFLARTNLTPPGYPGYISAGTYPSLVLSVFYRSLYGGPRVVMDFRAVHPVAEPTKVLLNGTVLTYLSTDLPAWHNVGGNVCGEQFWSLPVDSNNESGVLSPVLPPVGLDFRQDNPGYTLKYQTNNPRRTILPALYTFLTRYNNDYGVTLRHAYYSEGSDNAYQWLPNLLQADTNYYLMQGALTKLDKDTMAPVGFSGGLFYIKEPLEFKSAVSVKASNRSTIEGLFALLLRSRDEVSLFNGINKNDFDTSNIEQLRDWVSSIDNRGVDWFLKDNIKFSEFFQPYIKFFAYMIGLNQSKIKVNTYDRSRTIDYSLTTADMIEQPSVLTVLPENIYNTIEYTTKQFETTMTFNDDLSKGRYRIGNKQSVDLPAAIPGITSPMEQAQYLQTCAQRFMSIWGYPQYVIKFKTNLSKINIELGNIVAITDWITPDFDYTNPNRGLLNRRGIVIERTVDLQAGTIEFSVCYEEKVNTSYYSPAARYYSHVENGGMPIVSVNWNYIEPTQRKEYTGLETYSATDPEQSDYAGSNRYYYRARYGTTSDDGGVSPFKTDDHVELIIRNTGENYIWDGSPAGTLKVLSVDAGARTITLNQSIATPVAHLASIIGTYPNAKLDIRYANYEYCTTSQHDSYGWVGDITFESVDNPLPTPPDEAQVRSTQFAP